MRRTVLSYGETLWDLLPTGAVLGGAPFNFVYRANSLGDRGLIVTRLGRDELGRQAWERIVALGVETRFVQWDDDEPTGTANVTFDARTNPDFTIVPNVAYDNIETTDDLLEFAARADCICFGTLIQRTPRGRQALAAVLDASGDNLKLLDINLRKECFNEDTVRSSLQKAHVLKLNDDEAMALDGMLGLATQSIPEFAETMMAGWSLTHCVITFGEAGAFAAGADGERAYVPGYRVEAVDCCGAGDAFTAGFIHRLLRERSVGECCELGNALGAMAAAQEGGTVPISPDDIGKFLAGEHERIVRPDLAQFSLG